MEFEAAVTKLLRDWGNGDASARDELAEVTYAQLRRMAARQMSGERPGHTLSATGLVHEAFLRLDAATVSWDDRTHFYAVASAMMRRVLVDHAKGKKREKRGGGAIPLAIEDIDVASAPPEFDVLELDEALEKLATLDPRKVRIIELVFFGGLTWDEAAQALGLSAVTIHRELKAAKAWLYRELRSQQAGTK